MVKFCAPLFVMLLSSLTTQALSLKDHQLVRALNIYNTPIAYPSVMGACSGKIWVFSVSLQSIYAMDTARAYKTLAYHFANDGVAPIDVAAISCYQQKLLVTVNRLGPKPQAEILSFKVSEDLQSLSLAEHLPLPKSGRATDLFCNSRQCWVLQDQVWTSADLRSWSVLKVPAISDMEKLNSQKTKNPFDDWQSQLVLAKGKYTKGAVNAHGRLLLLDAFHSQIAVRAGDSLSAPWRKWGSFGAWEGKLLGPKSIQYLADDLVAIGDTRLKTVFLFSASGDYKGILSFDGASLFSPQYPISIAKEAGVVFVSDFSQNTVFGAVLAPNSTSVVSTQLDLRQNLYRRPEVLKETNIGLCLTCHDGTITNQLYKYTSSPQHHPISCAKCHDPHHTVKAQHYLQAPPHQLCVGCHIEYAKPATNHVWAGAKKGGSCLDCHQPHSEQDKLMREPLPQVCIKCHQGQSIHHRSVDHMLQIEQAKGLTFKDGKINCTTCHLTHVNWKENKFIRDRDQVRFFCASCHGSKADGLYKNFHKIMKLKGEH